MAGAVVGEAVTPVVSAPVTPVVAAAVEVPIVNGKNGI